MLAKAIKKPVLISDSDHIVAAAGISKKEMLERRISPMLEEYMEGRKPFHASQEGYGVFQPVEGLARSAALMYPIISSGDVTGAIMMLYADDKTPPTDTETKLLQTAASFLGKQMED